MAKILYNSVEIEIKWKTCEKKVEFIIKFKLTFFAPVFFVRICNQSILGIFANAKILYLQLSNCGKYAQIWKLALVSDF